MFKTADVQKGYGKHCGGIGLADQFLLASKEQCPAK